MYWPRRSVAEHCVPFSHRPDCPALERGSRDGKASLARSLREGFLLGRDPYLRSYASQTPSHFRILTQVPSMQSHRNLGTAENSVESILRIKN